MRSVKKYLLFIFIFVSIFFTNILNVNAYTLYDKSYFTMNGFTLATHELNGQNAYCMQFGLISCAGCSYYSYSSSYITEKERYIAGKIIEDVEDDYSGQKRFYYAGMALNCLIKLSGNKCNNYGYSLVSGYINDATSYVNNYEALCSGTNTSGCFNSDNFKITVSGGSVLSALDTTYDNFISGKITVSGMLSTYGGTSTSYTVSASSSTSNDVYICTDSDGSSCVKGSKTLSSSSGSDSFYIKVVNATANSKITIKAYGSNSATYSYATPYRYSSYYQALMVNGSKTLTRAVSRTTSLQVPDVKKYTITASKVDEYGDSLDGASFEIYKANKSSSAKIETLVSNSSGSSSVIYTKEYSTTDKSWFDYQYCFYESSAPNSYIYSENEKIPLCVTPVETTTSICYNGDNNKVNLEWCSSHQAVCGSSQGTLNGKNCVKEDSSLIATDTKNAREVVTNSCLTDEYSFNTDSGYCEKKIDPVEGVCSEGTLDNDSNKCVITEDPIESTSYTCSDYEGYTLSGTGSESVCVKTYCSGDNTTYDADLNTCIVTSAPSGCINNTTFNNVSTDYCLSELANQSYTQVDYNGGNINFTKVNSKNYVSISKTDATGDNELAGASMKICTSKPDSNYDCTVGYITKKGECSADSLEDGSCVNNSDGTMKVYMKWISSTVPQYWYGLTSDVTYYLVEDVAPLGYSVASYVPFKIAVDGTVTSGDKVVEDNHIIVKDNLTKVSISKQSITDSSELPGATLKLCIAEINDDGKYAMTIDNDGNCTVPILSDGEEAVWISTDTPKVINGLNEGSYYLIELITPEGYDTAEKILFHVNKDGSVVDEDGNSIENNHIVMYDKPLEQVPTGEAYIKIVLIVGLASLGYVFMYLKNRKEA